MRRGRIDYSLAEMAWLKANRALVISDYHRGFAEAFPDVDVSAANLHGLRKRKGWKVGRAPGRYVGRHRKYSPAEIAWLRDNCALEIQEYHAAFCAQFDRADVTAHQLYTLRKVKKWKTGRSGRFEKGMTPANKGKRCPEGKGGRHPNARRTQFKKGQRTGIAVTLYKPIGTERLSKDGYLERKTNDGMPLQARWRAVHLLRWEEINGPIPKGHALKSLDGDKLNTDPLNWELVPRGLLPRLNNRHGRNYDDAPAELKSTIMAVAKLEHRLAEKRPRRSAST